jgi:hypothetical protein
MSSVREQIDAQTPGSIKLERGMPKQIGGA